MVTHRDAKSSSSTSTIEKLDDLVRRDSVALSDVVQRCFDGALAALPPSFSDRFRKALNHFSEWTLEPWGGDPINDYFGRKLVNISQREWNEVLELLKRGELIMIDLGGTTKDVSALTRRGVKLDLVHSDLIDHDDTSLAKGLKLRRSAEVAAGAIAVSENSSATITAENVVRIGQSWKPRGPVERSVAIALKKHGWEKGKPANLTWKTIAGRIATEVGKATGRRYDTKEEQAALEKAIQRYYKAVAEKGAPPDIPDIMDMSAMSRASCARS